MSCSTHFVGVVHLFNLAGLLFSFFSFLLLHDHAFSSDALMGESQVLYIHTYICVGACALFFLSSFLHTAIISFSTSLAIVS